MPSRPSPGSDPWPVHVPSWVRRGSVQIRHVLCLQHFGPIQVLRWGPSWPVLVQSWSRAFLPGSGLDGPKQTSWPLPREGCGCLWDTSGGSRGKLRESARKIAGKFLPDHKMQEILRFRAPEKANLSGTLGRYCPEPCPHLLCGAGCFLKSTVTACI